MPVMIETVRLFLERECQLQSSTAVLVGVSGGPDSLCLLDLLERLDYPLVVAHFDHGIREQAEADASAVRRFAEQRELPFVLGREQVPEYATRHGMSIEEAARELRYRFLFAEARRINAQAVAVGHTADDQVETVLMHILRGAGLSGLRGMPLRALPNAWSQEIPLIRPLLATWKSEVDAYCAGRGLIPIQDESNLDTTYYRNRLRHELIPFLESYNPAVRQAIWRMANTLAADFTIVNQAVDQAWQAALIDSAKDYLAFQSSILCAYPAGIQRSLFRRAINQLRPGLRDVDYESVERALVFLHHPTPTQVDLIAGLRLLSEAGTIWLAAWETEIPVLEWPQMPGGESIILPERGEVRLSDGWRLEVAEISTNIARELKVVENTDPFRAWVAIDDLQTPLMVRGRQRGERFQPMGLGGHSVKLSEFMINVKMPGRARAAWPLVCGQRLGSSSQEIIWIPGYRLGHPFRLMENTQRAIALRVLKE